MKTINILLVLAFTLLFSCKSYSQVIETNEDFGVNHNVYNKALFRYTDYHNLITSDVFFEIDKDNIKKIDVYVTKKGENIKEEQEITDYQKNHPKHNYEPCGVIALTFKNPKEVLGFSQLMKHYGIEKKYWDYTFYNNCKKVSYPKEIIGRIDFILKVYINHKIKSIQFKTLDTSCDPKPPGTIMLR